MCTWGLLNSTQYALYYIFTKFPESEKKMFWPALFEHFDAKRGQTRDFGSEKNIVSSLFKNIQCTDCWCCYLVHKYASLETHCIGYKDWQVLVQFFVFPKYKRPFKKRCNACNKGYHAMVEICSYSSFILFLEQYWLWTFKLGI